MNTKKSGFTLIEMLVVVAIVGILSATILAALGPSRNKAKDARIQSAIKQGLVIAETLYDSNSANHYAAVTLAQADIAKLVADVSSQGGTLKVSVAANSVAFSSSLNTSSGTYYCSDSTGKTGSTEPTSATTGVCP